MKKIILFLLVIALPLCGCSDTGTSQGGASDAPQSSNAADAPKDNGSSDDAAAPDDRAYSYDKYLMINMDSTYEEVAAVLGGSGEASVDGDVLKQYIWENEDGSNISVTFDSNKATAKTQAYLGPFLKGKEKVTIKLFQKLKEGDGLADVEKILGPGTETMRQVISGEESVTYMWNNSDGSGISVIFQNNKAADINDIMLD